MSYSEIAKKNKKSLCMKMMATCQPEMNKLNLILPSETVYYYRVLVIWLPLAGNIESIINLSRIRADICLSKDRQVGFHRANEANIRIHINIIKSY